MVAFVVKASVRNEFEEHISLPYIHSVILLVFLCVLYNFYLTLLVSVNIAWISETVKLKASPCEQEWPCLVTIASSLPSAFQFEKFHMKINMDINWF